VYHVLERERERVNKIKGKTKVCEGKTTEELAEERNEIN